MTWIFRLRMALTVLAAITCAAPAALPGAGPASAPAKAGEQWGMSDFLRYTDGGAKGGSLDTSVVTFTDAKGRRVHLVAAVHVGEQDYYEALADDFKACDAVLYEMVKPKDAPAPAKGHVSDNGVAQLQVFLKDTLGLSYQLDCIDYRAANFVHADLDVETFFRLQEERGESFATLILSAMLKALANPKMTLQQDQVDLVDLMTRPDGPRQFRRVLARDFGRIEEDMAGLGGPHTVIVGERNKAAIAALRRALDGGKKEIAIFYGAAHQPDLARQLEAMAFVASDREWRMAWDLAIRPNEPSAFQQLMKHLAEPAPR